MSESYGKIWSYLVHSQIRLSSFPLTDYLFKFLVIGNAGVGKSCLLHQFIEQKCKYTVRHVKCQGLACVGCVRIYRI